MSIYDRARDALNAWTHGAKRENYRAAIRAGWTKEDDK